MIRTPSTHRAPRTTMRTKRPIELCYETGPSRFSSTRVAGRAFARMFPAPTTACQCNCSRSTRRACRKRRARSGVRDRRARGPAERQHLDALEALVEAPAAEVGAGVVEGVAELDEHVERHE